MKKLVLALTVGMMASAVVAETVTTYSFNGSKCYKRTETTEPNGLTFVTEYQVAYNLCAPGPVATIDNVMNNRNDSRRVKQSRNSARN